MKLLKKIVKWVHISIFLIGLIGVFSIVFYLETSIDRVASKEKQEIVWSSFNESEDLPEKFYTTIEKYYPRYFSLGVWESELRFHLGFECPKSSYNQLYVHPGFSDTLGLFWQKIILFELKEQCTSRKCYDYLITDNHGKQNT